MKKQILIILIIAFCAGSLFSQNVKFHKEIEKVQSSLKDCEKYTDKALKLLKSVKKQKELGKANDIIGKTDNFISKTKHSIKKARMAYDVAKKNAKEWGCESTVDLMKQKSKSLDKLKDQLKESQKTLDKARDQKKLKKMQSKSKDIASSLKETKGIIKSFYKDIEEIDESCK